MLGDRGRIRFWEDRWCWENLLCVSFPMLYAVGASKGATVGEVWETTGEETQRLINLISSIKVFHGEKDRIFWLVEKKGQYTVKANYGHLTCDGVHVLLSDLI